MSKEHIDNTLSRLRSFYEKAAAIIDAIEPGKKIPATNLAKSLASEMDKTGAQLYPLLLELLKDYPGVDVRRGAQGGIYKLLPGESRKISKTEETVIG